MRGLNSHFVPNSTFVYLQKCRDVAPTFSAAIRRTCGRRGRISSSRAPSPEARSPAIRRPREWHSAANGFLLSSLNTASTSSRGDEVVSDMNLFLEVVPMKMRHELFRHEEIGELIEVVMDLGRKPLARFPSGDWVISDQPVKPEDLRDAISKVVVLMNLDNWTYTIVKKMQQVYGSTCNSSVFFEKTKVDLTER